ncbi:MAG: nitroreductase family protein [Thermoguttaceae bacterium]|nr:nitroreductase family protein [Thermoguttaceae bacterium]
MTARADVAPPLGGARRVNREKWSVSMEFKSVIKERYSCKKYDGRKPNRAALDAILEAGRLAPTAKNLQEQRIYVLESDASLAKFDKHCPCRYGAGTVVVVAYDKTNVFTYPGGKRDSGIEDASIVATHMILAAKDAGVESCWLNFFDPDALAKELELPENEEILMALDLGYPAEGAAPLPNHTNRKPLSETVSYK